MAVVAPFDQAKKYPAVPPLGVAVAVPSFKFGADCGVAVAEIASAGGCEITMLSEAGQPAPSKISTEKVPAANELMLELVPPFDQMYEIGAAAPTTETLAEPLFAPAHVTF